MIVLIISKDSSNITELHDVVSITFSNGNYVIAGSSYSKDDYVIYIQG